MKIQMLLAYGLGALAGGTALLILIPANFHQVRQGAMSKAFAALALVAPCLLLVFATGAPRPDNIAASLATPDTAAAVVPVAGELKQDADWGLISHMYLGGPPPGGGAQPAANGGPAMERAQRSAAELTSITRREPGNVEAWLALAQAHRIAREYPAAINAYEAALKLDPRNADAWADYADALASSSNRKLAGAPAAAVARALKADPDHPKGLWLQASLDLEQHRYGDALAHWQKLRSLLPAGSPDITVIDANIAEARQLAGGA
ncbi:MAG: tetratricopeptide repeat protein [Steroidobacteraceae bacterium]